MHTVVGNCYYFVVFCIIICFLCGMRMILILQHNPDVNSGLHCIFTNMLKVGFGDCPATIGNGERSSTARAFLHPVMDRNNLTVLTNAQVAKVRRIESHHTRRTINQCNSRSMRLLRELHIRALCLPATRKMQF